MYEQRASYHWLLYYMSLFGHNIEAGESASVRSRLVVLPDPAEAEILEIATGF